MQLITPTKPLLAGLMLLAATQAHAKLTSYTVNGTDLVYSSVSNVTWTKDANLLGTMFASQGFDSVVNAILAASPNITFTPNFFYPSGTRTLMTWDFSSDGSTSWFGANAFVSYLNSINYGGTNQWYLPTMVNFNSSRDITTNGTTKGDELSELFYQELNTTVSSNIPNTATFDNEQTSFYWSGTTELGSSQHAFGFNTEYSVEGIEYVDSNYERYAWAVSPGQIKTVPAPEPTPAPTPVSTTYNVKQTYSGPLVQTETLIDTGLGYSNILYQTTVNFTPTNLEIGDASLFSSGLTTTTDFLFNVDTGVLSCAGICQFTETLKNGDTIFGSIITNGASNYVPNTDPLISSPFSQIEFTGEILITGGTGMFKNATGYGTYTGVDDYVTKTQTLTSTFFVTAVPEPESAALLLVGLGLLGAVIRRRQQ